MILEVLDSLISVVTFFLLISLPDEFLEPIFFGEIVFPETSYAVFELFGVFEEVLSFIVENLAFVESEEVASLH